MTRNLPFHSTADTRTPQFAGIYCRSDKAAQSSLSLLSFRESPALLHLLPDPRGRPGVAAGRRGQAEGHGAARGRPGPAEGAVQQLQRLHERGQAAGPGSRGGELSNNLDIRATSFSRDCSAFFCPFGRGRFLVRIFLPLRSQSHDAPKCPWSQSRSDAAAAGSIPHPASQRASERVRQKRSSPKIGFALALSLSPSSSLLILRISLFSASPTDLICG